MELPNELILNIMNKKTKPILMIRNDRSEEPTYTWIDTDSPKEYNDTLQLFEKWSEKSGMFTMDDVFYHGDFNTYEEIRTKFGINQLNGNPVPVHQMQSIHLFLCN